MATIICDQDVLDLLSAADAVRWMGAAVDAHHRGELVAPPRAHATWVRAGWCSTYVATHGTKRPGSGNYSRKPPPGRVWASRAGAVNADFYNLRWVTS